MLHYIVCDDSIVNCPQNFKRTHCIYHRVIKDSDTHYSRWLQTSLFSFYPKLLSSEITVFLPRGPSSPQPWLLNSIHSYNVFLFIFSSTQRPSYDTNTSHTDLVVSLNTIPSYYTSKLTYIAFYTFQDTHNGIWSLQQPGVIEKKTGIIATVHERILRLSRIK